MAFLRPFKSLLVLFARHLQGRGQKEVAAETGLTLDHFGAIERGEMRDPATSDVKAAITTLKLKPAEVVLLSAFLDALDQLDPLEDPGEAALREMAAAAAAQQVRLRLGGAAQSGYPALYEVELDRQEARDAWQGLRTVAALEDMALVVSKGPDYQTWAMIELLCDESTRAASKDVGRARDLALVAVLIAADLRLPEDWRCCLLGYAVAHLANAYRVVGDLGAADWTLEAAKRLWNAGRDTERLLDPGRLFDLEGSLRRAQRRFRQALSALEQAAPVTRRSEQVALNTAFTLQAMGEYEQAIQVLLAMASQIEAHPERRLLTIQRFNLASCLVHVDRHREAALLLPSIRQLVDELQDDLDRVRCRWLEGRVAAGFGYPEEALKALDEARQEFFKRGMHYDVALCLVESLVLRLSLGNLAEVERLAGDLKPLFAEKALNGKPMKALLILDRAVARREATAELAGRLLSFLFRARRVNGL